MLQLPVLLYFESGIFTLTTLYIALTKNKRMFSLWKIYEKSKMPAFVKNMNTGSLP